MTELLSNIDLEYYCKELNIPLNDVLSKDLFNTITPKQGCYIINMESSFVGNGTHWTALILRGRNAIYFDSFGLSMPNDILNFIHRYDKRTRIFYSLDQIQHLDSIFCGWFCLYFLWFFSILYKNKLDYYGYLINKHNEIYSKTNKYLNDRIIQKLIKNIFSNKK